jgi:VWFA-related protein
MVQFLRALSETDRIALYSLGKDLHILQDFTSDPQKLIDGIAKLDPGLDQLPDYVGDGAGAGGTLADSVAEDCKDFGPGAGMCRRNAASTAALQAGVNQGIYNDITTGALERIIEHLSGVPGRKNLVWLKEHPEMPPGILAMLEQANIALYPVMTHSVEFGGLGLNEPMTPKMTHVTPGPEFFSLQHAVSDLAASTGGAGFDDAADLTTAVRTAEEDAQNSYTLGYYPPEEALDGKFHRIIVKVSSKTTEARYRPGYLATKSALPAPAPSLADLMESPLDATAIGLSAQATPDPERFGFYRLRITVDLRDIHLERKDGRLAGGFDVSFLFPNSQSAKIKTYPVEIAIAEDRLAETIKQGYSLRASGLDGTPGEIFVAVRDRATGAAGSLRIPFARQ